MVKNWPEYVPLRPEDKTVLKLIAGGVVKNILYDKVVDWYLELFRKHDVKICVMLADSDGEHIYRRLAKHMQVVWIDVFAGNYSEPKKKTKRRARRAFFASSAPTPPRRFCALSAWQ